MGSSGQTAKATGRRPVVNLSAVAISERITLADFGDRIRRRLRYLYSRRLVVAPFLSCAHWFLCAESATHVVAQGVALGCRIREHSPWRGKIKSARISGMPI